MLHIKDIEAFASINEALARNTTRAPKGPPHARRATGHDLDSLGAPGWEDDRTPASPMAAAALFGRMFLGRR